MYNINKVLFAASLSEFKTIEKNDFASEMEKRSSDFGFIPGDSEIKSWKENCDALKVLIAKTNLPNDVIIAFEYQIPVGGGRIDCMLFGRGADDEKNVVHIELKQWSNENVTSYYDHHTFRAEVIVDGYSSGSNYTSHPSAQVSSYDNILKNHLIAIEKENLHLYGFAYCYNYQSDNNNCALLDNYYKDLMEKYPLFCENQILNFSKRLEEYLCKGKGDNIFWAFVNSEVGTTKRLYDVAANMLEGADDEFCLVGDQIDVFESILGAVKNTKKDEKTAIIVKGGPGTGKSVIAMRLLSELYKPEYDCKNVFYATRSSSLRDGWKKTLQSVARRFGQGDASSLIQSTYDFKPYRYNNKENGGDVLIVDEAHRISYKSNDQTDSYRDDQDRSYFPQILSMLYTSRVCVFFIDDKQSIVSTEIGLSSNIEFAARNYYDYILKANAIFLGKRVAIKDDPILKEIPVLSKLISEKEKLERKREDALPKNDDKTSQKIEKSIRKNDRMINLPILNPNVEKINILSFELKDQFRCNGSNNYLVWLDQILYNSDKTNKIKLNTDSYEFDVFDDPNELYAKIRSLDSYARVADRMKEDMGELFSYKELMNRTKGMSFYQSARIVAGWCWDWNTRENPQVDKNTGDLRCEVDLNEKYGFALPWETQQAPRGDFKYKYAKDADSWCNQKEGVNQVGCIHSIQGWETDYVGVIIGPDLVWDDKKKRLCYNPKGNNHNLTGKACKENDLLILNTYRVLLTRGKKGCFIFACDPKVRKYFKDCMKPIPYDI